MVLTETFPYHLADKQMHRVSLSVSGTEIQLIIDCHPLYSRVIEQMPDRNFSASNMSLLLGQRNPKGHYSFKVSLVPITMVLFGFHFSMEGLSMKKVPWSSGVVASSKI